MIRQKLAHLTLKLLGWHTKIEGEDLPKCVICVAPHTSNLDFFFGKLAYTSVGRTANFLIKKGWFFFPLNLFWKFIGGVAVNRMKNLKMTDQMVSKFKQLKSFKLAITPEGTRKLNPNWKSGFYHIALKAEVPIALFYIDYRLREVGCFDFFYPTGDEEKDMWKIKSYYERVQGKHPQLFSIGVRS
ncbi:MAG TPA: acyltransferase [Porphyromonadaceae bacterium]|nr:acyltransferase [Porphyromonadaceae bacterium]